MKHLFLFVLIVVAIVSTSCSPTRREKQQIIRQYFNDYTAYQFDVKYKFHIADTVFQTSTYIVFSKDIFDAERQFEPSLNAFINDYFEVSYTHKELQVDYEYPH